MAIVYVTGTDPAGKRQRAKVEARDGQHARERATRHGLAVDGVEADVPAAVDAYVPAVDAYVPVLARQGPPPMPHRRTLAVRATGVPTPISAVADPIGEKMRRLVESVMTQGETLGELVVQKKPIVNMSPDAVAATSRRVIVYRAKLLGRMDMQDFIWTKLLDAKLSEGMLGATLTFRPIGGAAISIDHLPKDGTRALYRFAQQQEEHAAHVRRERTMEESRAAAGGVTVNSLIQPGQQAAATAPPTAGGDLMSRMRSLKEMFDAGLIDQVEFAEKRAEIMRAI